MDIENIIWIVIFLIYMVSVIRKKKRAASKEGTEKPVKSQTGWKAKIDNVLSQIKKELEASKKEQPSADTVWEELMQYEADAQEPAIEKAQSPVIAPVMQEGASPTTTPAVDKIAAEGAMPAFVKESPPKALSYEIQDLRKAVIWSEILAPPLALRNH